MGIAVGLITAFLIFAMRHRALVPDRLQSMAELSYEYVADMVRGNLGEEGMKFFPWVFTIPPRFPPTALGRDRNGTTLSEASCTCGPSTEPISAIPPPIAGVPTNNEPRPPTT